MSNFHPDFPIGFPDDSKISDISFPSHISGLESFADLEGTVDDIIEQDRIADSEMKSKDSITDFLKVSSPPASNSNSMQSLNESSISLTKLEAMQGALQDSFLNSHSDDSEREKNMQQFLLNAVSSEKMDRGSTLSELIESQKRGGTMEIDISHLEGDKQNVNTTANQSGNKLNQTELDSLFLKEVRNRLQLSSMDGTSSSNVPDDMDQTLKQFEESDVIDQQENRILPDEISEKLNQKILRVEQEIVHFEDIQRPHLDGSSSDSDIDTQIITTSGATNFARTAIQTSYRNNGYGIQQELEEMNLDNIPERQHAEGIDNEANEVFGGDGGGGGDGSSGHSDSDVGAGGDGGVAIRNVRMSPGGRGEEDGNSDDEDDDGRTTPPSRERPVGGSGVSVNTSRQVHFSNTPNPSKTISSDKNLTPSGINNNHSAPGSAETTPQDSRLSARYFLAASTPFKTMNQSENNNTTNNARNWLNQTSINQTMTNLSAMNGEERTLVGAGDITMDTPGSMTLSQLRRAHDGTDWTLTSSPGNMSHSPGSMSHPQETSSKLFPIQEHDFKGSNTRTLQNAHNAYNPFESFNGEQQNGSVNDFVMNDEVFEGSFNQFEQSKNQDLEAMFNEDERAVAMSNNSVFKETDDTGVSEWSVRSQNRQINSIILPSDVKVDEDNGRVSAYFKTKSKELGKLSGDGSVRPKFSDDTHEVITPPSAMPIPLLKENNSTEQEKTIPLDALLSTNGGVTFATNTQSRENGGGSGQQKTFETPKSTLLKTHKRNSNTVLQKKEQKRQLIGGEATPVAAVTTITTSENFSNPVLVNGNKNSSTSVTNQKYSNRNVSRISKEPLSNQRSSVESRMCDTPMSTEEISTNSNYNINPPVSIPSSELEATTLLNDIKERRVSTVGLGDQEINNLAKLIATMTGTDETLVYQLICLLPKKKQNASSSGSNSQQFHHQQHSQQYLQNEKRNHPSVEFGAQYSSTNMAKSLATVSAPCFPEGTRGSNYISSNGKVTPCGSSNILDRCGKPIPSVIPINAERPSEKYRQPSHQNDFIYGQSSNHRHDSPYSQISNHDNLSQGQITNKFQYLQSTARIPDRYSDPNPVFEHLPTERMAVSVSPVRHRSERSSNFHSVSAAVNFQQNSLFQERSVTTDGNGVNSQFLPLSNIATMSSRFRDGMFHHPNPFSVSDDYGHFNTVSRPSNSSQSLAPNPPAIFQQNLSGNDSLIHADSISFPRDMNFKVCCVGTFANQVFCLKNTNRCWIQCQLQVTFFAFNGREMDHRCNQIFLFPPKATLEPNSSEEIKIKFQPEYAGSYMLKLEFLITPLIPDETNVRWQRLLRVMNVDGTAENPNVELIFGESKFIDFGEMSYGSLRKQELKILNKGRADVPIQLQLTDSPANSNGPYFSLQSTSAEEKDRNSTGSKDSEAGCKNASQLSILVCGHQEIGSQMKPKSVILLFQAPKLQGKEIESNMSPPTEYTNQLLVSTNTKNVYNIGNVFMKAVVGLSRLHSLRTMQAISFNTTVDQKVSRIIPLRNAGNITLHLQPKIIGGSDYFTIHPDTLKIKPNAESEVKVTFSSSHSVVIDSRLFVTLLPDGDQYEWHLRGTCTSVPSPVGERASLLCNKLSLNWASVTIGHSKQQKLILKNNSESKIVQLSVSVQNGHPNFQIQSSTVLVEKGINRFEAVLKPNSELPVHVSYKPTCFASVNSSLVLRMINGTTKCVIPLTGYGGSGNLDIHGAKKLNDEFLIEMGKIFVGKKTNTNIILRNSGTRASFVCMKCFSDVTSKIEYPSTHVTISPNNFVLAEKTSCQITLTFQPLSEHAVKSQNHPGYVPAHLAIYSGDEVLRKEFRRIYSPSKKPYNSNVLRILPLMTDFMNETIIKEAVSFPHVTDWESFFLAKMSRNLIALVPTLTTHRGSTNEEINAVSTLRNARNNAPSTLPHHPNIVTSTLRNQQESVPSTLVPVYPMKSKASELWTVTPRSLTFNNNKSSTGCKLKLINYSSTELTFKLEASENVLIITPSCDKIPAFGELGVRVDPKQSFLSKFVENVWKGQIFVQCNEEEKVIDVELTNQNPIPSKERISMIATTTASIRQTSSTASISPTNEPQFQETRDTESGKEPWCISPQQLLLDPSSPSSECKLRITNNTGKDLPFEFIWPAETLVITPSKDKVPAFGHLGIRVDPKHTFLSRQEEESWFGSIYIQCNGEQKCIKIRILKPKSRSKHDNSSPPHVFSSPHDLSLEPHQHVHTSTTESVIVTPQVLDFAEFPVNGSAELAFTLKNISQSACQWNLLSICPSYFKSTDEKSTISRVSYPVFQFKKLSGRIDGNQTFKLPVTFHPKDYGMYSQFWDLEISGSGVQSKIRLELIGKGKYKDSITPDIIANSVGKEVGLAKQVNGTAKLDERKSNESAPASSNNNELPVNAPTSNKSSNGHVFVKDDSLEFPLTEVGKTHELKFRLCNDSREVQKVRVSGFRGPFSVNMKHVKLNIRPKSYIRVPVFFTPTASNTSSEGLLILTPDNGENLCVKLSGKS